MSLPSPFLPRAYSFDPPDLAGARGEPLITEAGGGEARGGDSLLGTLVLSAPFPTLRHEHQQHDPALITLAEVSGDALLLLPVTLEEAVAAQLLDRGVSALFVAHSLWAHVRVRARLALVHVAGPQDLRLIQIAETISRG
jgi:hypothetical protein